MNNIQDAENPNIPDLPGFDLDDALHRLRGRWEMLKKLIISFGKKNAFADEELRSLIENGEFELAKSLAHQLKGAGANLGARDLSATASKIEALLRDGEKVVPDSLMENFVARIEELRQVLKILECD